MVASSGAITRRVDPKKKASPEGEALRFSAIGRERAGNGTRTHDIQLGKLTLYQLSYTRRAPGWLTVESTPRRRGS